MLAATVGGLLGALANAVAWLGRSILLVEGSTGGADLRGLQGATPEPLTCSVLNFNPTTRRLVAYDRITVEGLGQSGVNIERFVVDQPSPTSSPSAPSSTAPVGTSSTPVSATTSSSLPP